MRRKSVLPGEALPLSAMSLLYLRKSCSGPNGHSGLASTPKPRRGWHARCPWIIACSLRHFGRFALEHVLDGPFGRVGVCYRLYSFFFPPSTCLHMHMISCIQRSCLCLPTCFYRVVLSVSICLAYKLYTHLCCFVDVRVSRRSLFREHRLRDCVRLTYRVT